MRATTFSHPLIKLMSIKQYFGRLFSSSKEATIAERNAALLATMAAAKPQVSKKSEEAEVDLSIFSPKELEVAAPAYQTAQQAELQAQLLAARKADLEKRQQALKALRERQAKAVRQLDDLNQGVEAALIKVTAERISLKRDNEHQGELLLALKEEQGKWTPAYLEAKALEMLNGQTSAPPKASPTPKAPKAPLAPVQPLTPEQKLINLGCSDTWVKIILDATPENLYSTYKAATASQRKNLRDAAAKLLTVPDPAFAVWKGLSGIIAKVNAEEAAAAEATPEVTAGGIIDATKRERLNTPTGNLTVSLPANKTSQPISEV